MTGSPGAPRQPDLRERLQRGVLTLVGEGRKDEAGVQCAGYWRSTPPSRLPYRMCKGAKARTSAVAPSCARAVQGRTASRWVSSADRGPRIERPGSIRPPESGRSPLCLASAYTQLFFYDETNPEFEREAFLQIERALDLDSNLAEAYLARAQLTWTPATHSRMRQLLKTSNVP